MISSQLGFVIASAAKQSIVKRAGGGVDRFVAALLAMTTLGDPEIISL